MTSTIGTRLRTARLACGYTLAHVSDATGIAPADLAWMEGDGLHCPTWLVVNLAALYGVPVGWLLLHPALLRFERKEERSGEAKRCDSRG